MNPKNEERGTPDRKQTPQTNPGQKPADGNQSAGALPKPGERLPRVDDRPAGEDKRNTQGDTQKPAPTDIPDYGDRESNDPRRTNIEAGTRSGKSASSGPDDGPVQSSDSPSV
ncbi:MAG TPA: hypothetical protein VK843_20885 [Planctomycetota bacterium]|nr:hypothetical protein [Planctomycetota bacterium]